MIQGAVIRVIGVVLGLFVIFSVVSPVAGGLDELYLHSVASCNFGTEENPERALIIGTDSSWTSASEIDADDVEWGTPANVLTLRQDGTTGACELDKATIADDYYVSANGAIEFESHAIIGIGVPLVAGTTGATIGVDSSPTWAEPAGLFDEQPQLVELLATIAALALPLGALGAVVFFGNTISVATGTSGVSSQIIAVITIVVVILVIVEVFGQFIVYLDQAFDVIDADRFAVYDNGLGTLAETITSFWGILAFASVLPIGFSLFRQYQSGGGIAGFGGGGSGRGV